VTAEGSAVVTVNCLVAAVLINAALVKLASPDRLLRALRELIASDSVLGPSAVRLAAVVELTAGLGLMSTATIKAASLVAATLGIGFGILGLAGWLTRSKVPCGCIGGHSDRPLGKTNVSIGLLIALVLPVNTLIKLEPATSVAYSQWTLGATALASLAICAWLNRSASLGFLKPVETRWEEGVSR